MIYFIGGLVVGFVLLGFVYIYVGKTYDYINQEWVERKTPKESDRRHYTSSNEWEN